MTLGRTADFLVIGGGIIGLAVARELVARFADASVVLIEKEPGCGAHASGRNSGVLHAGFYYTANSLKARFTVEGNRRLTTYVRERGLEINPCGKLVVPTDDAELAILDELAARGRANGVRLEEISADAARKIEPRVRAFERALYSETTSSVSPREVVRQMATDAAAEGIRIHPNTAYRGRRGSVVRTTAGDVDAGYVVNAAGLHADRIAADYDFGLRYAILPFKGLYLYADRNTEPLATHVYPVPNLANPWLGVHFTVTTDGRSKIGPTAIPALWREQYRGLERFSAREFVEIAERQAALFVSNHFNFRALAVEEIRKHSRRHLVKLASRLVEGLDPDHFRTWGEAGIRAQLYDKTEHRLEMDFVIEGDGKSMHVLNAVSPAFTCAFPFSAHVVRQIATQLS